MAVTAITPDRSLELVPGSLPVEEAYDAIRAYQAGALSADDLIAVIDSRGDELEVEIAARALETHAEMIACVERLSVLADQLSTRLAQWSWCRRFPNASRDDVQPPELTVVGPRGAEIPVRVLVNVLRRLELDDEQLIVRGRRTLAARLERTFGADDAAAMLYRLKRGR